MISLPRNLRLLHLRSIIVKLIEGIAVVWPAMVTGTAKDIDLPRNRDQKLYKCGGQPRQPDLNVSQMLVRSKEPRRDSSTLSQPSVLIV